jgi:hypothetical protein
VSQAAIVLIRIAAVAHASWNLFSKQASVTGAVFFIWLVAAAATAGYAPVVAVLAVASRPHLTAASWIFMAGTGILQTGYKTGALPLVYPVGRAAGRAGRHRGARRAAAARGHRRSRLHRGGHRGDRTARQGR